jgi:hypothetical protein
MVSPVSCISRISGVPGVSGISRIAGVSPVWLRIPFEQAVPDGGAKVVSFLVNGIAVAPWKPPDPVPIFIEKKSVILIFAKCNGVTRVVEVKNGHHLLLPFCERALAAAVLDAGLVRPSLSTLLAAVAALLLVCLAFLAIVFCPC